MTQEEKQLLLRDLCARLPYGVKAEVYGHNNPLQILGISKLYKSTWAWNKGTYVVSFWNDTKAIEQVKPYLRPMSSMTEEEKQEYYDLTHQDEDDIWGKCLFDKMVDYCNKHHLDYRGLIEKCLALEAPEGMYKTESL